MTGQILFKFNNNNNNTLLTIDSYKVLYTYPQIAEASRGG